MPFSWYLNFPYILWQYSKNFGYILNSYANLRAGQQFLEQKSQS